jgi:hypothetical protein
MTMTPSPQPARRRRPKHPARRTRLGLSVGAAVTTLGLTGAYWVSDLQAATSAASPTSTSSSGSSVSSSSDTQSYDFDDDDDDYSEENSSSTIDVTPSYSSPNTSSRAS